MKSKDSTGWLLFCLLCFAALFCGCSVLTKPIHSTVPGPPRLVETYTTNAQPTSVFAVTNPATSLPVYITNTPPPVVVTNLVAVPGPAIVVTNYVPNPQFIEAANTVQALNGALNPTPTAPMINIAASLVAGLAGAAAAWQNRKANKNKVQADEVTGLLQTVVAGIETMHNASPAKEAVAKAAAVRGVSPKLDAFVQANTVDIPEPSLTALELLDIAKSNVHITDVPSRYQVAVAALRESLRQTS